MALSPMTAAERLRNFRQRRAEDQQRQLAILKSISDDLDSEDAAVCFPPRLDQEQIAAQKENFLKSMEQEAHEVPCATCGQLQPSSVMTKVTDGQPLAVKMKALLEIPHDFLSRITAANQHYMIENNISVPNDAWIKSLFVRPNFESIPK